MSYTIDMAPKAEIEFFEAWLWYEEKQTGLGDRFEKEFSEGSTL